MSSPPVLQPASASGSGPGLWSVVISLGHSVSCCDIHETMVSNVQFLFLQCSDQALLSFENSEAEERLQCVHCIIARIVQESVWNIKARQNGAERLAIIELASVLMQTLIVDDFQEVLHCMNVEVEGVQVLDVLFDVVADDDHLPQLSGVQLRRHDVLNYPKDLGQRYELRVSDEFLAEGIVKG